MKKYIFLIILIFISAGTYAQVSDPYGNLEKYWYYRYRLVNDFTKIGNNVGESMPAQQRCLGKAAKSDALGEGGYLKWAEGTIDLGNYMQMLATEYHQLENNGYSTTRTLTELQYAVNAFYR